MSAVEASALDPRVARSRAAVIEATLALLGEVGYVGLSIDGIARRSGVARTTIYRHWSSLGAIVHEAAMTTVGVKVVPDTGDARADLRAHLGELVTKLTTGDWGRMLPVLVDAAARDEEILDLQRRSTAERKAAAMAIVARGVENGQIRGDVDLVLVGEMLVGPIFSRHLVTHLPITDAFVDDLMENTFRLIGTTEETGRG